MKRWVLFAGWRYENGKLLQLFLDGKRELWWKGRRNVSEGRYYQMTRTKDGSWGMAKFPETHPNKLEEERTEQWCILSEAAKTASAAAHTARKLRRQKLPKQELATLARLLKGLTYAQKRQVFEWLIDELD